MSGRIRTIKPELLEDERVSRLSSNAFRLFVAAILLSDDYGNFRWASKWLQGQVFWGLDTVTLEDVIAAQAELVGEVQGEGLVCSYTHATQWYAHVKNWQRHQKVDRPGKPRVPTPEQSNGFECFPRLSRDTRETLATDLRPPTSDLRPTTTEANPGSVGKPTESEVVKPQLPIPIPEPLKLAPAPQTPTPTQLANKVLDHWAAQVYHHGKVKLTSERRKRVTARIADGFTVEDLKLAIEGAALDPWLMGTAPNSTKAFKDVDTILRDASQVERLRDLGTDARRRKALEARRNEQTDLDRLMQIMPPWAPDPRKGRQPTPEELADFKRQAREAFNAIGTSFLKRSA